MNIVFIRGFKNKVMVNTNHQNHRMFDVVWNGVRAGVWGAEGGIWGDLEEEFKYQ